MTGRRLEYHPGGTVRVRVVAVFILLVSYGALGARQPAVRTSIPLPVPAAELAQSFGLDPDDRSQLLVSIVRALFDAPDGLSVEDQKKRGVLMSRLKTADSRGRDRVPLPLDKAIWRETLLQRAVPDVELAAAIMAERSTALLYHGLAALDDDTLGWLGPERETLLHLRRNAGVFATFGRSVNVRGGRVVVPGGPDAEPVWASIVGADPGRPGVFVQRLIRGNGRLAWFYDTVMHLDANRRSLVLGVGNPEAQRVEGVRDLLTVFEEASPEWQPAERPFVRPMLDPGLLLSLVGTTRSGGFSGPDDRLFWDAVFRDDAAHTGAFEAATAAAGARRTPVEPAWLARRIALAPQATGRRRLETFLFSQRVFPDASSDDPAVFAAVRGAAAFPALALTLERIGIAEPSAYAAAARTAAAVNTVSTPEWRRVAVAEFQSALAILDRARRMGGLDRSAAARLVASLVALPVSLERGFGPAFAEWLQHDLIRALPMAPDAGDPVEDAILWACSGGTGDTEFLEWEGRRYRVDPAAAELKRLRLVRAKQRGAAGNPPRAATTLDGRLAAARATPDDSRLANEQALAATLVALVYAMHLGEPTGAAVAGGDVSARHDFRLPENGSGGGEAWRIPREERNHRYGWHVSGSLLGLDVALARLALRRLDLASMPGEPTMSTNERTSATHTAALFGPVQASDGVAKAIAAAIARGRQRVAALRPGRAEVERIAGEAGLSEWRREALAWTLEQEPERAASRFSLVELFRLGSSGAASPGPFDRWGAATVMLDGCLCLRLPDPMPWENFAGRPSAGYLATRGSDVTFRVAELLTELELSPALAPAIVAYAMQEVIDSARPAFFDDWPAVQKTARDLPRERLIDFVAAAAATGVLVPAPQSPSRN